MDVLIVLSDPSDPYRVEVARRVASRLGERLVQSVIRATPDDATPYALQGDETTHPDLACVLCLAGPGASYPAALASQLAQPVILLTTVAPGDAVGAAAAVVTGSGSASGPLARVAINAADEAAALAAKLVALAAGKGGSGGGETAAAAAEAAEAAEAAAAAQEGVDAAVSGVTLACSLGALSPLAAAEARSQAYLPLVDAERRRMGAAGTGQLGAAPLPEGALAPGATRYVGKVRDVYLCPAQQAMVMVATGRQSAFDRHLASVPFKGQVLNQISLWWFEQTKHLVPNHVLCSPHPNVVVGRMATIFPVEFVVRGYVTGTTDTSMWTHYSKGARQYCGYDLPEGMVKNQKVPAAFGACMLTPTTKSAVHDEPISPAEVVRTGLMTQAEWDTCESYARALFTFGSQVAASRGLILVDTKYEFGKAADGTILLCDEVHTPDSSRYWLAEGYDALMAAGQEPNNIDKEFLRRWFRARCDPYKDAVLPEVPPELVCELSRKYIMLYEIITGSRFAFPPPQTDSPDAVLAAAVAKATRAGKVQAPHTAKE